MRSVDENLEALSRAVLSEARNQSEQTLKEAREKAEAIRERASQQAAVERKDILEHAALEAELVHTQAVATAQLKARTLHLEKREELLDSVFEAARQQIPSVQKWEDYDQIAIALIHEALKYFDAGVARVLADKTTQGLLTDQVLADISKEFNVQLTMGPTLNHGLGIVIETTDKRLRYDNTFETRLTRMRNALRTKVYQLLTGESL